MVWGRLDDKARGNSKLRAIGKSALGGLVLCWAHAAEQGTDGWLPTWVAKQEMTAKEIRAALEVRVHGRAGLLHQYGDGSDCSCLDGVHWTAEMGGYWIHDWLQYNPGRSEVRVHKAKSRELNSIDLRHAVKMRDGNSCRYCGVVVPWNDNRSSKRLSIDHVNPLLASGMDNLVVACTPCNSGKRDASSPEAAGMTLLAPPVAGTVPADGWPKGTAPDSIVRAWPGVVDDPPDRTPQRPEPIGTEPTDRPTGPTDDRSVDTDADPTAIDDRSGTGRSRNDPRSAHDPAVDQADPSTGRPPGRPTAATEDEVPPGQGRGRRPAGEPPVIGPPTTPRSADSPSPYRRGATSNTPVPGKPPPADPPPPREE